MKSDELSVFSDLVLSKLKESLVRQNKMVDGKTTQEIKDTAASLDNAVLNELLFALKRIDKGTYGQCVICRHDISPGVLESNLTARLCKACESAMADKGEPVK